MTRVPSRQFYPTIPATPLQFFRYGSTNPLKIQFLSKGFCSESESKSNPFPSERPNSVLEIRSSKNPNLILTSSTTWLGKWNQTRKKFSPKSPRAARDYRENDVFEDENGFDSGTVRVSGGTTMERIVEKLKKFGYVDDMNEINESNTERRNEGKREIEKGSVEDMFYVEDGLLPNPRGGFSRESPLGVESVFGDGHEVSFPWEKRVEERVEKLSVREKSRTSVAELTLPESELRRLRNLALRIKNKMRVKGGGVTQAVVEMIHEKWKSSEIVRLKIEGAPALNMKRMHMILERKTGGLVIWRSGTSVSLYRGVSYESPLERANKRMQNKLARDTKKARNYSDPDSMDGEHAPGRDLESGNELTETNPVKVASYEDEVNMLLDGLGPRYADWPGGEPLPIDADLLPGTVAGYQPPFRILPYGVRGTLSVKEATNLRRLARVLPPHFALGRSRQHQGLAVAMIKLWERSSIAKIAIKRGVQLTTSERMAEDIKKLTGGMLLSRNKDFLVFYRGKNFLSSEVAEALLEKERLAKALQDEEEQMRLRASASALPNFETTPESQKAGTLEETLEANARWAKTLDHNDKVKVLKEADALRHSNLVRKLESKLGFAERKLMKAERNLSKVEECLSPAERQSDPDSITDEERFMFRKLGLRMKAFLLLGRRGVFGGTVENMHLHWKYRELVKIIVKAKNFEEVKNIALSLEAESGGVLVSVDKVSKGYAIVVFRGKDYQRPSALRPKNLLTKRKALARSIELQRREALLNHISTLETRVAKLRSEIEQVATVKHTGNEELYDELESAYSTEDDDSEEEEDVPYADTDNDREDENDNSIQNDYNLESDFRHNFQDQELGEPGDRSTYATMNES